MTPESEQPQTAARLPFADVISAAAAAFAQELLFEVPELSGVAVVLTYHDPQIQNPYAVLRHREREGPANTVRLMQQLLRLFERQTAVAADLVAAVDTHMQALATQLQQQDMQNGSPVPSNSANRPDA